MEPRRFRADNRHNRAYGIVVGNARVGRPTAVVRVLCPGCQLVPNPGDSWPHDGRDGVDPLRDPSSSHTNGTATIRTFERSTCVRGGFAPEVLSSAVFRFMDILDLSSPFEAASLLHKLQRREILPFDVDHPSFPLLSSSISRQSRLHFERISPWFHPFPPDFSNGGGACPSSLCLGKVGDDGHSPSALTLSTSFVRFVLFFSRGSLSSSYRSRTKPNDAFNPFGPAPTRIVSSAPVACPDPLPPAFLRVFGSQATEVEEDVPFGDTRRQVVHWDRGQVTSTSGARQLRRSTYLHDRHWTRSRQNSLDHGALPRSNWRWR